MARIKNMKTIDLKIAENEENLRKLALICFFQFIKIYYNSIFCCKRLCVSLIHNTNAYIIAIRNSVTNAFIL